jgi:hypothetical protein
MFILYLVAGCLVGSFAVAFGLAALLKVKPRDTLPPRRRHRCQGESRTMRATVAV